MSNDFAKKNAGNLSRWLIIGILGLVLIFGQRTAKTVLYSILAVGIMLAGAAGAVNWWKQRSMVREDLLTMVGSVALFVIGLWILTNTSGFDTVVNVFIGLILIITGAQWLTRTMQLTKDRVIMVLSCISIIFGLIIMFTNAATSWLLTAEGIGLVYTAITGLLGEWMLGK